MSQLLHFVEASTQTHFEDMSRIHAMGWRTTYADAVPKDYMAQVITDHHWVPFFREDYQGGVNHGLLLYHGQTPVACGTYGPARTGASPRQSEGLVFDDNHYHGWGEVLSFYTHPQETDKGYGSLLITEILRRLTTMGYQKNYVLVLRENTGARRFYARHGFTPDGTHVDIPFPPDTICVDLRYVWDRSHHAQS